MAGMLFKKGGGKVIYPKGKNNFPEPQIIPVFGGYLDPLRP
jgi:hypothetical protein